AEDENTGYQGIAPLSKMFNAIARLHREGPDSDAYKLHESTRADFMWQGPEGMRVCGTNGSQLWDVVFITQALTETGLASLEENKDSVRVAPKALGGSGEKIKYTNKTRRHCLTKKSVQKLKDTHTSKRLYWAVDVLLSLQNPNGGFASYELIRAPQWIETLNPAEVFDNTLVDCCHTEYIQKDIAYIRIMPNMFALECMSLAVSKQRDDGGWGEDFRWKSARKEAEDAGVIVTSGLAVTVFIDSFPASLEWIPATSYLLTETNIRVVAARLQDHYRLITKDKPGHPTSK
ncbi:hypothetical protein MPER_07041, partial [Moniliophthora perniciosa FA553]